MLHPSRIALAALLLFTAAPALADGAAHPGTCNPTAVIRARRDLDYAHHVDAWAARQQATLALTLDPAESDRLDLVRSRARLMERSAHLVLQRALAACAH
jgi:hypothetical protein